MLTYPSTAQAPPMSYEQDFASDPKSFMDQHVFVPMFPRPTDIGGSMLTAESGEFTVRVVELPGSRVMNPQTGGSKVFHMSLDISGLGEDSLLKIYWLPYRPNDFRMGTLTGEHRYMFTPAMNGCTLGFGSQSGSGACLVTHANNAEIGTAQGAPAQADAQLRQLHGVYDDIGKFTVLEPAAYRIDTGGDLNWTACNFGICDGSHWTFWTAKYRQRTGERVFYDFFHGGPVTQAVPIPPRF
jgi:hypothetical protein